MSETDHTIDLGKRVIRLLYKEDTISDRLTTDKVLFIICFISFVATFDFTILMFFADIVVQTFFTAPNNKYAEVLQLISISTAGFIAPPLGAYFMGRYGDQKGRRPVLLLAMGIFCLSTVITACLPTYAQIGILAPILLIIIRWFQGAAFGSQIILGWVYIAESLPRQNLATHISKVCASIMLGTAACAFMATIFNFMFTEREMVQYGWRFAFIVSAILSVIAMYLSRKLHETPLFLDYKSRGSYKLKQSQNLYNSKRWNALALSGVLCLVASNLILIILLIMPKLIALQLSIGDTMLSFANITGIVFIALGELFYGRVALRYGTGRTLLWGSVFLATNAYIFFYYLTNSAGDYIIPMYGLLGFSSGIVSLCILIMMQLFPINLRLTSTAVVFNCVTVFSGAILPLFLLYATEIISFSPALYILFICMCGYIVGLHTMHSLDLTYLKKIKRTKH